MGICNRMPNLFPTHAGQVSCLTRIRCPLKSNNKMQTYFGVKVGPHEAFFSVTFSPFELIIALAFFVFVVGVWNLYRDWLLLSTFYLLVGSDSQVRPRSLYYQS